jgi:hypothetical protein
MPNPYVGATVQFFPHETDQLQAKPATEPLAGIIAKVNIDGSVNIALFDAGGSPAHGRQGIAFVQAEGPAAPRPYCQWPKTTD